MLNYLANPARFMRISGAVLPWLGGASLFVLALGLAWSLLLAPPDYQQGESVRIMFIHVPAAWMALSVYLFVAIASAVALVWRHQLASGIRLGGSAIDISLLIPLLVMALGCGLLFGWLLLLRMRTALNERKARALRLYGMPAGGSAAGEQPIAAGLVVRRR